MKNKLLELLTARCRDMGLTSKAIEELANLGSAGLAEDATDEDVASKVDSLIPFAKLAQAEITRKTRKVKSTEKQSDNEGEGEGTNQRDNEVPEWFKTQMESLTKQFEALKAENDKFKADNAKAERANRIATKATELGIPSYLLKRISIPEDADFEKELTDFKQELVNNNLLPQSEAQEASTTEALMQEEAKAWAKGLQDY